MSETVVQAIGIGKRFRLGGRVRYRTLRDSISNAILSPVRALHALPKEARPKATNDPGFWALRDVSFEIRRGEVIGFIGRNGAGKSTLLKILSRITEPTEGQGTIRGRVGALLEVGTGFHPELSGRENVYLNGAILGMRKNEIDRRFDQIVAFAEVERFLDTQVKHYSSGMQMRLAFAVAAHLEPEILIADEVLAVGDASFQKKCLNRMDEISREGRTVIFVSHSMSAVTRLCQRAVLLDAGRVVADGPAHQVVSSYLSSGLGSRAEREWTEPSRAPGSHVAYLRAVRVRNPNGGIADSHDIRHPIAIEMDYEVIQTGHVLVPNLHFMNDEGVNLFVTHALDVEWRNRPKERGAYRSTVLIPGNFLAEGTVIVGAALSTHDPVSVHFFERDAVSFQVIDSLEGDSARGDYAGHMNGVVRPLLRWETSHLPLQAEARR